MPHVCHASSCNTPVPPSMLMCRRHWFMVPKSIQREIWVNYRVGQEVSKDPSDKYMIAYKKAVNAVDRRENKPLTFPERNK